ncbi:MAG: Cna B-type domain-containing protein, partial [Tissierellia bacterium]|nr:Cna B-type domain-containing protein [Tissierellia bacterium]
GEFSATKNWQGDENVDRPTLNFTLYRKVEGKELEKVPDAEVKEITKDQTSATWTGLEETDIDGKKYIFSVKEEVKVANVLDQNWVFGEFDSQSKSITNRVINNDDPNNPEKIAKLTIKKVFENEPVEKQRGSKRGNPPIEFSFKVTGPYGYSETFNLKAGEEKVLEKLYYGEYKVEETNTQGYTPNYSEVGGKVTLTKENKEAIVTVINKNIIPGPDDPENPNVIEKTVEKVWVNGSKPDTVIELWRKGTALDGSDIDEKVGTFTANKDVTSHTFKDLAKHDPSGREFEYYAKEPQAPANYTKTENGLSITNTYTIPTNGEFSATKNWQGDENVDRPEINLTLYRRILGAQPEKVPATPTQPNPIKVNPENPTANWTDLEETDINGNEYVFHVEESFVDDNPNNDNWTFMGFDSDTNTLTNRVITVDEPPYPDEKIGELTIEKILKNEVNTRQMTRKAPLEFEFKVTGPANYSKTFKLKAGDSIVLDKLYFGEYTVTETNSHGYVPNYSTVDGKIVLRKTDPKKALTVTNTHSAGGADDPDPNLVEIEINKVWINGAKPDTVIELWRKGQEIDGTIIDEKYSEFTANKDVTSHTFKDLAKHDPSGREFEYYAKEENVPANYTATYSEDKLTITNSYTIPKNGEFSIKKIWQGDEIVTRPELEFTLYRRILDKEFEKVPDAEVKQITKDQISATWKNLEETDIDGNLYEFAVKESVKEPSILDDNWVFNSLGDGIDEYITIPEVFNRVIVNEDPDNPDNPDFEKEKIAKLIIKKEIKGGNAYGKLFKFKITGPYGFEKEIELKANEKYTLEDIYFGEYKVEELNSKDYTVSYSPGQSVKLEKAAPEKTIVITNTAKASPYYPFGDGSGGVPKLNKRDHFAYVIGYPDYCFKPEATISRAEMAAIFARLLDEEIYLHRDYHSNFNDVKEGDWHYKYISKLTAIGVIKGYPDGSFKPNQPVTRGEFASVASRFIETEKNGGVFLDVNNEYWARADIERVLAQGWVKGYPDGSFRPLLPINRAEVVTIVNKMLDRFPDKDYIDLHKLELYLYDDLESWYWAYYDIMEASNGHDYIRDGHNHEKCLRHWCPHVKRYHVK